MLKQVPKLVAHGLLLAVGLVAGLNAVRADDATPAPSRSLFQQVIAQPTGRNGYEELVVACDHLKASKVFAKYEQWQPTLPEMRFVLADRHVVDCLRMLSAGLSKPITSPRATGDYRTTYPELSAFRSIARLLRMEQTVLLADGRTAEAVASYRRGLEFGRAIQFDTLIQGLVGVAIEAIQAKTIGEHIDQLSARDCEELYRACLFELRKPDPAESVLQGERRFARTSIGVIATEIRKQGPAALTELFGAGDDERKAASPFVQSLMAEPQGLDTLMAQVQARIDQYFESALLEMRKPAWQRRDLGPEASNDNTPAGAAASMLVPGVTRALDSLTSHHAYLRLIACHCAIRRYEWENGSLPVSIEELRLGDVAIDPFLGEPLQYTVHARRYTLLAAGRKGNPDDPRVVNGRLPIAITKDDL